MADVILRMDSGHGETCVPDIFIDEYMPAADGEFVKVYLYLLRCMKDPEKTFSVADTAASFGCSAGRVIDALKFWEHTGLLRLDFDSRGELSCVCFTRRLTSYTPVPDTKGAPTLSHGADTVYSVRDTDTEKPAMTPDPAVSPAISNADRRELLMIAETYLGRTLNSSEVDKLYDWIDKLKLPAEVIDYLIDYCVTHDHTAFSYMDKIAVSWASQGIDTLSKAKDRARDFDSSGTYDTVRKAFGISGRNLVESEKNFIRFWTMDLSMSDDLISLACERTILKTSRASFEYADRILHSWHDNSVSSTADVTALDEKYRAQKGTQQRVVSGAPKPGSPQFSSFENRSYDQTAIDDIQRALLKV